MVCWDAQEQEAWEKNALANIKRLNEAVSEQKAEIDSLTAEKQKLVTQMWVRSSSLAASGAPLRSAEAVNPSCLCTSLLKTCLSEMRGPFRDAAVPSKGWLHNRWTSDLVQAGTQWALKE